MSRGQIEYDPAADHNPACEICGKEANSCECPEKYLMEVLWKRFQDYADEKGINLDHPDDWRPWWNCYITGVEAYLVFVEEKNKKK